MAPTWLIYLCSAISTTFAAELVLSGIKTYDTYGYDSFGLVYENGQIEIPCACEKSETVDLAFDDKKNIKTAVCADTVIVFRLNINQQEFPLGTYTCVTLNGKSQNSFLNGYRICADENPTCARAGDCARPGLSCYAAIGQTWLCNPVPYTYCTNYTLQPLACPVNRNGLHCALFEEEYSRPFTSTWTLYRGLSECQHQYNGSYEPDLRVERNEMVVQYDEAVMVSRMNRYPLRIVCPFDSVVSGTASHFYDSTYTCEVKDRDGSTLIYLAGKCHHSLLLNITDDFFTGVSKVYKMVCTLEQEKKVAYLSTRIAVFDSTVKVQMTDKRGGTQLKCVLDEKLPPGFFVDKWFWTSGDSDAPVEAGETFVATEAGSYHCHATLVFKTCAPTGRWSQFLTSEIAVEVTAEQISLSQSVLHDHPDVDNFASSVLSGIGVLGFFNVVLIIVSVRLYLATKKQKAVLDLISKVSVKSKLAETPEVSEKKPAKKLKRAAETRLIKPKKKVKAKAAAKKTAGKKKKSKK